MVTSRAWADVVRSSSAATAEDAADAGHGGDHAQVREPYGEVVPDLGEVDQRDSARIVAGGEHSKEGSDPQDDDRPAGDSPMALQEARKAQPGEAHGDRRTREPWRGREAGADQCERDAQRGQQGCGHTQPVHLVGIPGDEHEPPGGANQEHEDDPSQRLCQRGPRAAAQVRCQERAGASGRAIS